MSAICLRAVEFRAADTVGDGRTLEGYGAVFDTPARIDSWEGSWDETIASGAFKKTLRARMPVLQFDHGRDARTGSVPIGAIDQLAEDEQGLFVRARLFNNPVVEPIRQAIAGNAINGMSFRFQVAKEEWRDAEGNKLKDDQVFDLLWSGAQGLKRNILEVDPLYELGPVVFPAYEATSVGVRSMLAQLEGDERKALIRELAAELRRLPQDFTGRSTEAVDGGETSTEETGTRSKTSRRKLQTMRLATAGVNLTPANEKENHDG